MRRPSTLRVLVPLWLVLTGVLVADGSYCVAVIVGYRHGEPVPGWMAPPTRDHASIEDAVAPLAVVVLTLLALQLPQLVRMLLAWRAAAGPPAPRRASPLGRRAASPEYVSVWVRVRDGQDFWLQRVYWERWFETLPRESVDVTARHRGGRIVIDIDGYGRLWPAGPARREVGGLEPFEPSARRFTLVAALLLFVILGSPVAFGLPFGLALSIALTSGLTNLAVLVPAWPLWSSRQQAVPR
jgi:hypothetical protein